MDIRKLLAEAVGTFVLVGMGSLAIVSSAVLGGGPVLVVVPFGFGLGLLAAIAITGHISGGHYNPAVTLGALLDRRIEIADAIGYVIAQVVGAAAASAMILVVADRATVAATRNLPSISDSGAFVVEVALTAIFIAVILTVTRRAANHAAFVIPLTLAAVHFAGIPLSGASVNPARALGPALIAGDLTSIWIYLTAPFVGAVVGWVVFRVLSDEASTE